MVLKVLKRIGIGLVAVIALVLILASLQPNTFTIKRSTTIKAPPEKVYALINDLHKWNEWSPWEKLDPNLKRTYSGEKNGVGAIYEWEGNDQVGKGRMEITESKSPSKVKLNLDFLSPFEAHNYAEFTLTTKGDSTDVVWEMGGPNLFMGKVMGLFISMDSLIGKDFETGLANMKTKAEK